LERKQRLDDLGFVWDPLSEAWEEGFTALKAYKKRYNDCHVPQAHKLNGYKLGTWVSNQRIAKDQMLSEHKKRLDDLGFVWDSLTERWEAGFEALNAYKEQHGDCRVPGKHKLNSFRLGQWVAVQRAAIDQMLPERKQRLDDLGSFRFKIFCDPLTSQRLASAASHDQLSTALDLTRHILNSFELMRSWGVGLARRVLI
ncbi:helicase associated domain-containing protein, partial [Pseudomonadales bacterium]|nr:helicase associated domain-containing protein [Pseudomonadales bacterium]